MRFGNKPVLDDVPDEGSELHSVNLLVIATAFDKSRLRMVVSITLQCFTAAVKMFFSAAGFFTPLDLDPTFCDDEASLCFRSNLFARPGDSRLLRSVACRAGE